MRILVCLILIASIFSLLIKEAYAQDNTGLISLGVISELTGPNAVNGSSCLQGVEVAKDWLMPSGDINGKKIRLVIGDNRGEAKTGVAEFKKLIEADGAFAVLSTRSQIGMAINPISKILKAPILGVVGHARFVDENPFAFRFYPSVHHEGPLLAKQALSLNKKTMGIVTLEDEWTLSLTEAFNDAYQKNGGKIIFSDTIVPEESDLATIATRLAKTKPDAAFVNLNVAQNGLLIRKLREKGFKGQLFSNFWSSYSDVIKTTGNQHIEGLIYVSINLNKPKFRASLARLFPNTSPSSATYSCYGGLAAMLSVIQNHSIISRDLMYEALLSLPQIKLLDETIELRQREAIFDIRIGVIRDGNAIMN